MIAFVPLPLDNVKIHFLWTLFLSLENMRGVSDGIYMHQDWRSPLVKDKTGSSNLALPSFSPKDGNYLVFYCCVMCVRCHFSQVQLFETLWTIASQAPLSMGFSRQEYWSGLPCPPPRDLSNPGMGPVPLLSPCIDRRVLYLSCHLG